MIIKDSFQIEEKSSASETSFSVDAIAHVSEAIFVRCGEYYCKILYTDILWLGAYNNYCEIHHKNGKMYCAVHPLVKVEKMLPHSLFVRIHRSYIINIHTVDRFIGNMVYIGKQRLDVSRPYRHIFSCFNVLEDCKKKTIHTDGCTNHTDISAIPIKE